MQLLWNNIDVIKNLLCISCSPPSLDCVRFIMAAWNVLTALVHSGISFHKNKNTVAQIWKLNDWENFIFFTLLYLHTSWWKTNSISFDFWWSSLKVMRGPVNRLHWQCKTYFCSRSEPVHYGAPAHTKSNLCLTQTLISPSWILREIWTQEQLFSVGEQLQCRFWCLTSGENVLFINIFILHNSCTTPWEDRLSEEILRAVWCFAEQCGSVLHLVS